MTKMPMLPPVLRRNCLSTTTEKKRGGDTYTAPATPTEAPIVAPLSANKFAVKKEESMVR